ncbi:MAG: GAF domain-containing protein [Terriglobales bacterium]
MDETPVQEWLASMLVETGAIAGTVHWHQEGGLRLAASVNIPPPVQQAVAWVPRGKGMAGLALERNQPVQTCNLREDQTGAIKPGAKAVDARAAVALPVAGGDGSIRAVVGIAFADEREIAGEELERLQGAAATLPASHG